MIYLLALACFYLGGVVVAFTDLEFHEEPNDWIGYLAAVALALGWPLDAITEWRYRWRRKEW